MASAWPQPPHAQPPPPPSHRQQPPVYHMLPPDDPPPSYDDATRSSTVPLLVGPPPNYGTYEPYSEPDASSVASSEIEQIDRSLPEWVGQAMVVLCFVGVIYIFWRFINDPDGFDGPY